MPEMTRLSVSAARSLFPVTREYAYFNVAANAPLATPVRDALVAYADDVAAHGAVHWSKWFETARATRASVAALLAVALDEVALLHNTSEGINVVAQGLDWKPGDSVVVVRGDFPANVHPWLNLRRDGVEARFVEPGPSLRILPDDVLARCDDSTRLVAVSAVSFVNGFRMDVRALGAALRARGILLFVDAIQALGHVPLSPYDDHVDFLAADGHKWLLGPEGIGLFFVRKALLPRLRPRFVSWLSVEDPYECSRYDSPLRADARRFEYATPNTGGIHAFEAALALVRAVGIDAITPHALGLARRLADGVEARGYRVGSPRADSERSGIVAFMRDDVDPVAVERRLLQERVVIARRGGFLRAACHLYNDASDVDRLLDALP